MPTTTTTTKAPAKTAALQPLPVTSMQDLIVMGQIFSQCSTLGVSNPAEGFVVALTLFQERMTPKDFAGTYHLVKGKITMQAQAMLARFKQAGGRYEIRSRTADEANICLVTAEGQSYTSAVTWAQMQESTIPYRSGKLLKDNWSTPYMRQKMLWARAVSDGVRTLAPEVISGCYTPEEAQDFGGDERPAPQPAPVQLPQPTMPLPQPAAAPAEPMQETIEASDAIQPPLQMPTMPELETPAESAPPMPPMPPIPPMP